MTEERLTYVVICHCWRIEYNPFGGGLVLLVDRGISCEGHTHAISAHCTNTPSMEVVSSYIEENREDIVKQIEAFVEFQQALGDRWGLKEGIAALFCTALIREIAGGAEAAENKLH